MKTKSKNALTRKAASSQVVEANIVDVILTDHTYLKDCIDILKDMESPKRTRLSVAKNFLDTLEKHSVSENKVLYDSLVHNKELRNEILEGKVEHGIADMKVKLLKSKVARATSLKDEIAAELKVLAEIVEHHIKEEEKEMLPKVRKNVDKKVLEKLGARFLKMRKFTPEDVEGAPEMWLSVHGQKQPPQAYPALMMFPNM